MSAVVYIFFLSIMFLLFAIYDFGKSDMDSYKNKKTSEPPEIKLLDKEFIVKINKDLSVYVNAEQWRTKLNTYPRSHHFIGQIPMNLKITQPKKNLKILNVYHTEHLDYMNSFKFIISLKNKTLKQEYQLEFYNPQLEYLNDLVYVRVTDISNLKPNGYNERTLMTPQENYKFMTKNPIEYYFNQYGMECAKNMHYDFCLGINPITNQHIYLSTETVFNSQNLEISAIYNSSKYGGLRIEWRMVGNSIKDWQKIDAKIFEVLETLNVETSPK